MPKTLIMFIENNQYYQESHYFLIWCRFAHKYFLNNCQKIQIPEMQFESSHINQIQLSFTSEQPNINVNPNVQQTNNTITYNNAIPYNEEDDNDDDVQYLITEFNKFKL